MGQGGECDDSERESGKIEGREWRESGERESGAREREWGKGVGVRVGKSGARVREWGKERVG